MGQDELPPADLDALREAVVGFYEESIGRLVAQQRRGRPPRRLHPLWLVVLLPWLLLVGLVRFAVTRRDPWVDVRQQQAFSLYRQLSGKDPTIARAELGRIYQQLMAIDQRVEPPGAQWAMADATHRAALGAAAGALLAYDLGGRQTDDVLLGEIQAAWMEYEVLGEQRRDQQLGRVAGEQPPSPKEISDQERAAMGRYVAGWRAWFDRQAEQDGLSDPP